jgi:membrane protein implicated in regulation of membrane protease activity
MHTIDVVYLTCLGIGVCYALVAFLAGNLHLPNVHIGHDAGGGHVGDVGHVGHVGHTGHADVGHAAGHDAGHGHAHADETESVSFISPITVSTFLAGFGAAGVVTSMGLGLPNVINLPVSFATATGIAYVGFRLFVRYFIASQSSSESIVAELVGTPAEVSVAIAPGCIGAITYTDVGRRYSMPAHAADGQSFEKGAQVFIMRVEGGVAEVWQGH